MFTAVYSYHSALYNNTRFKKTTTILWPLYRSTCVNWRILLVQSFSARMPLLTATSAFGLGRRRWSSPQQWYLHCLHTVSLLYHYISAAKMCNTRKTKSAERQKYTQYLVLLITFILQNQWLVIVSVMWQYTCIGVIHAAIHVLTLTTHTHTLTL